MPNDSPAKTASAPKFIVIGILLVVVGFFAWLFFRTEPDMQRTDCDTNPELSVVEIRAEGRTITAEVAETGDDKARGLSNRNCLNPDSGMLFTYALSGDYCYWMKDMNFSIDMIWLDDEKQVVTIHESVSPDTYPNEFCPEKPAQYVLEVPAGYAADASWNIGTLFNW